MKKMTFLACATLLTSAVVLNSCKSDEPINGPQYDGEVVKTEFAISMPSKSAGSGAFRMPGDAVQTEGIGNFQGMTGISLIPFINLANPTPGVKPIAKTDTRLGANILLDDLNKSDIESKNNKAKLYDNVSIPLSTGSFLFYARSKRDMTDKFSSGSLIADIASEKQPAAFSFSLEPIQDADAVSAFMASDKDGGTLLAYLNKVATANDGPNAKTANKYWYEYTTDSLALHNLFDTLTTMHGLSSFEVERVLTDLYKSVKPIRSVSPIAKAICDSIELSAYATITNDTVHLKNTPLDLTKFPKQYSLPEGSIEIVWNSTSHKFEHSTYTSGKAANPSTYVYPAQLWYFANSCIQTSNSYMAETDLYTSTTNYWTDILAEYNDDVYVSPRTRSVAIADSIQYAVARLDVQLRLKNQKMDDNSDIVEGVAKKVDCTAGFPVTAVLVGGQKNVGFDFTPATLGVASASYTVYDTLMASNTMKALYSTTTYSDINHTLVLENGQEDVMVAIEMKNTTGVDFYGAGGQLIPKNSKFYVVAKLEYSTGDGKTINTPNQVFKQDYTTLAKLTLKDLKSAYNTIPDLRTPQLELGFAVDLSWEEGNVYEIEF